MPSKKFKSIQLATLYVFDNWKPGKKFYTTELMSKVQPLLEPKVVKDSKGRETTVERNPFPDTYLKVLRKCRRQFFVCIDRHTSFYEKINPVGTTTESKSA